MSREFAGSFTITDGNIINDIFGVCPASTKTIYGNRPQISFVWRFGERSITYSEPGVYSIFTIGKEEEVEVDFAPSKPQPAPAVGDSIDFDFSNPEDFSSPEHVEQLID